MPCPRSIKEGGHAYRDIGVFAAWCSHRVAIEWSVGSRIGRNKNNNQRPMLCSHAMEFSTATQLGWAFVWKR